MSEVNASLIEQWIAWMRAGSLSPETLRVRRSSLRIFAAGHDLLTATGPEMTAYLDSLPGGAWSRHGHLAALRGFCRWARTTGLREDDPTLMVHPVRTPEGRAKPVPECVLRDALTSADDELRLILLLGAYAGLRRAEIAHVHSDDVDGNWLVVTGKGQRTRRVPIHPLLRAQLDGVSGWALPHDGGHVTPWHVAHRVRETIDPWTTHTLRFRFAKVTYAACRDLRVVQALLGHANPQTTALYVGVDEDRLTAAVLAVA